MVGDGNYQGVAFPMPAGIAIPQTDVPVQHRLVVQVDDAGAGVEQEQDVVGILADLESVPHQRLGWSSWRATCQGFHILGFEGVKEMCRKLLLQGADPGLERELPIRWRYQSAWSAVLTIRTRGLRLIVVVIGKISLWVHHIVVVSHCVGPVPLDVWLPVGQYRSVPVGF